MTSGTGTGESCSSFSRRSPSIAPNQRAIQLTSRELELLACLMAAKGGLVTKQTLVETMGTGDVEDGFHRIESQLTRLRRKTLDGTGTTLPVRARGARV